MLHDNPIPSLRRSPALVALSALALALAACTDEITPPNEQVAGTFTIDAAAAYGFASLADGGGLTLTDDPTASDEWDMGFFATTVTLNGGEAGPGGVIGYCLCQNADATDEQVLAMTPESELADFEAVDADDIPAAAQFTADVLTPAIDDWVSGTGTQATLVAGKFWKLRLGDGTSYAKFRIAAIENSTATHAGTVTIEYAVQADDEAAFGPTKQLELDLASGPVSVDLNTDAVVESSAWDVRLDGWHVLVNSGISGAGAAGAAAPEDGETFETVATAVTAPQAYLADRYAGVFGASPWYRYNLTGQHRIHPTFDVYLVRRGAEVYKVQLTGYYGPAGQPRHIGVRYEKIAG